MTARLHRAVPAAMRPRSDSKATPPPPRPRTIPPDVDCVVVGGGPVGLLTAVLLGQAGLRVAVVERRARRYPAPHACTVDHEAMRILQAVDWGRAAQAGWATANSFHQADLEAALEDLAAATPGVTVHRGWTFLSLTQTGHAVSVLATATDDPTRVAPIRARWLIGADGAESAVRSDLGFRASCANIWRDGNVFLAGDAARLASPLFGLGLCAGLRDARALTWRLALVHRGLTTPFVLDSYGPERAGQVRMVLDENGAEGGLAPQGRIRVGDRSGLFDDVLGGGWQLISRAGDPGELLSEDDLAWFRRIGGVVADLSDAGPVRDLDGGYEQWFARHRCQALLARPDFYVFAAGQHTDIAYFVSRLRQALPPGPGSPVVHRS
ncbi:hypothetical protein GCM10009839_32230 [Catenulispora yoronensis]|uniref:FAD-binding domain-containing protein n=1 Tax=Catenulispora yoronensis TaxID=450799 RepID=A0ABP5FND1_9ACTN